MSEPSPWSPEICKRLRDLVRENKTSPQIAVELNLAFSTKFTKSAVISKCAKLGLLLGPNGGPNNRSGTHRCFWGPARRS